MDQRNLILAIVLSVSILLGFQLFIEGPRIEKERALQEAQKAKETAQPVKPGTGGQMLAPAGQVPAQIPGAPAIQPPGAPDGAAPPIQDGYAYGALPAGEWTPHRIRCLVLHRRKVGGSAVGGIRRMELAEAGWFLDSLAGKPSPTRKEVQRARRAGALQAERDNSDD